MPVATFSLSDSTPTVDADVVISGSSLAPWTDVTVVVNHPDATAEVAVTTADENGDFSATFTARVVGAMVFSVFPASGVGRADIVLEAQVS